MTGGDGMSSSYIEVKLPKHTVFLTPEEIHGLLRQDVTLYKEATQRGKHFKRSRTQRHREQQKRQEVR